MSGSAVVRGFRRSASGVFATFSLIASVACTQGSNPVTACVPTTSSCEAVDAGVLECTTFTPSAECVDFFYMTTTTSNRIECGCVSDIAVCLAKVRAYCAGDAGARSD